MKRMHNNSRWLLGIMGVLLFALPAFCDEGTDPAAVPPSDISYSSSGFKVGIVAPPIEEPIPEANDDSLAEPGLEPAMLTPASTPLSSWMLPYSTCYWLYPTPTPVGYRTPTPAPTSTPDASSAWVPPEELFAAFGPGMKGRGIFDRTTDKQEITVTYPNRPTVKYDVYEDTEYDPNKETLAYSLLMEAYRAVYLDLFGIPLTTPTPASIPTAPPVYTPTPEGYKTPVPAPSLTPSPTPDSYCVAPLKIANLENMWVAHTRATKSTGWKYFIARASAPTASSGYGYIYDNGNSFYDKNPYESQSVAIRVEKTNENYSIQTGDYITLTYDGSLTRNVYPPHISGPTSVYYYVDSNGATYSDELLCNLVQAVPTPTPVGYKTPIPTPSPSPEGYKTPTPIPTQTPYCGNDPLEFSVLEDLSIAFTRSTTSTGWVYRITRATKPGGPVGYGYAYDNRNTFEEYTSYPEQAVAIRIYRASGSAAQNFTTHTGDWVAFTYDGGKSVNVYPPAHFNQFTAVYYFIDSHGSTYSDEWLCELAKAVPTPTAKSASRGSSIPVPAPTISIFRAATPEPIIALSPSPLPAPSPYLAIGPVTFDLVDTLSVGSPVWSVWADDRYLYGGAGGGEVHIWERTEFGYYFLETIGGYSEGNIYGLQSVRDNSRRNIYGASEDGSIYAWSNDLRSGGFSLLAVLDQAREFMYSVAGDGEIICGANNDGGIYVWDGADFSLQTVLDRGLGPMLSVCLDDEYIYSSNVDGAIYLWDRDTMALSTAFSAGTNIMWAATVDSNYCYGGSSDPSAAVWRKGSFLLQTALPAVPGQIGSLSSDDRKYLYGAGPDGMVYAWKNDDFSLQRTLKTGSLSLNSVYADRYHAGDTGSHYIYGGSADGKIYIWQAERTPTPTPTPTIPPSPTPMSTITPGGYMTPTPPPSPTPSPRGYHTPTPPPTAVPTSTPEGFITPTPKPSPTFGFLIPIDSSPSPTPGDLTLLAILSRGKGWMFSVYADDDYIYGANEDNYIYLWDRSTYQQVAALTVPDCKEMLSVYADEKYIYGSNDDSRVYLWDRNDFSLLHVLGDGQYYAESVFADSEYIYSANYDGSIYVWNRGAFDLQSKVAGPGGWLNSVYADSGRIYAASGGADYNVYLWDRATFDLKEILTGASDDLNAVRADGSYIYGASADSNIYLWDYSSFYLKKILSEPINQVTAVISGGDYIYGSSLDHGIYIWEKGDFDLFGVIDDIKQPMQWVYVDGSQIFAASRDGKIYVWQAPSEVKVSGVADSESEIEYPPVPPPSSGSGSTLVVNELLSVGGTGDYYGGIAFRDGYLYENTSKSNSIYKRDPVDGTILGRIDGLETTEDMGLAWDPDNNCWYIAGPWAHASVCSRVPASGGKYNYSWDANSHVAGLYYDPVNHQLLASSIVKDYINIWEFDGSRPRKIDTIQVGSPQNGAVRVGDKIWAALATETAPCPVYELNMDGSKTGRSFELPEGREAWDMAWDGEYIWVRSDYLDGKVKIYQIDINSASSRGSSGSTKPVPTPVPGEKGSGAVGSSATPLPPHYEWKPELEPYDSNKETLNYPLLQETYKKVYKDLFGILLTTPTPPPTPIPTPSSVPSGSTSPTPIGGSGNSVVINEVNWGGTISQVAPGGQWIELYNYGDSSVSLSGWSLGNGSESITLSGTIGSKDYFVLAPDGTDPTGGKRDLEYDTSNFVMNSSQSPGNQLTLNDSSLSAVDTLSCNSAWAAGDANYHSMERYDPEVQSCSSSNWNTAVTSSTYNGLNYGTPGEENSQQKSVSVSGKSATARKGADSDPYGASSYSTYRSLMDFADWIDFQTGNYFKLYEWDLTDLDPNYALFDYLPNCAFIYLVTGYKPTGDYYKEKLLELVRDKSFDWGGEEHCRYIADIAESYLSMIPEGFFSEEERAEIEKKFYDLAIGQREYYNNGNYGQGVICGLNAVVGYIVGGKKGGEMISWSNQLLSYDDTWTLPENSSYYQGLFIREMLRVALYSNRMTIPDVDSWGVAWKPNFARQIEWIIDTFPHNGFNPSYGQDYRQNYINHFMAPLVVATTVLDDDDPDHIQLAGEARWLLQKMFNYGTTHFVSAFGEIGYGYEASQWGPFAILLNPVYLYWYLNEGVTPTQPGIGGHTPSRTIYRPMSPKGEIDSVYDKTLSSFQTQPDKFIHRSGWGENDLYLMLDPAYPAAKSGENKYSFANNVVSLSYGQEEFLTGVTMNYFNPEKTNYNLSDILGSYIGAELVNWVNDDSTSRSVTRLKDGKNTWTREITLYKTGDRRIEVKDILSRRGSVYWHFQGFPQWQDNGVVLDINNTSLQVTWEGAEQFTHQNQTSWSDSDPTARWCYSGDPDREVKLYRSTPGVIVTTFRGL